MSYVSRLLFIIAYIAVHPAVLLVYSAEPMVYPSENLFVASNSMEVSSYNCTVATGYSAVWEVEGTQYNSESAASIGLSIVPMDSSSRVSMISITNVTRQMIGNLSIQCVSVPQFTIGAVKGMEYHVVTFDRPNTIEGLRLVPSDGGDLILRWERPDSVPNEVPILYTVQINNTETSTTYLNITTSNSFSLQFLEDQVMNDTASGVCIMFEFSISGSNEAGAGLPTAIVDTIPISPDVTLISKELTVERVGLQPLSVQISFPPVNNCSVNFPLHNYTIKVDDKVVRVLLSDEVTPDEDGRLRLDLNSSNLSEVTLDDSLPLMVTACNDIICRTSDPVTLNTTDVQAVEAIYFRNRLFLRCSFADNSQARGCVVRLSLTGDNGTERYEFLRKSEDLPCVETEIRLDVYSEVVVVDLEEDGSEGNGNLTIRPMEVTTLDMYTQLTRCPAVSGIAQMVGLSSTTAIIIGVVLSLIVVAVVIIAMNTLVLLIMKKRRAERTIRSDGTYELIQKPTISQDTRASAGPLTSQNKGATELSTMGAASRIQSDAISGVGKEDDSKDTEPLIKETKEGYTYENETETIIINIQNIAKALGIQRSKIKNLRLK